MNKKDIIKKYFNRIPCGEITEESFSNIEEFKLLCRKTILDSIERGNYIYLTTEDLIERGEYFLKLYKKQNKIRTKLKTGYKEVLEREIKREYKVIKSHTALLLELMTRENIIDLSNSQKVYEYIVYELGFLPAAIFGKDGIHDMLNTLKR